MRAESIEENDRIQTVLANCGRLWEILRWVDGRKRAGGRKAQAKIGNREND
jgi:hypothetical protein